MFNFLIYLITLINHDVLSTTSKIKAHKAKLQKQYKNLIEEAYNWRQTDSALSDISEYRALKLLDKINKLKFLERESLETLT